MAGILLEMWLTRGKGGSHTPVAYQYGTVKYALSLRLRVRWEM
jgi:hypothetical protein